MEQYLIDTNVVSDYLKSSLSSNAIELLDQVIDDIPNLSIITQLELLCWKTEIRLENTVADFITDSIVLNISPNIIKHSVSIRRINGIKLPDAIIAATALANDYTLITNNEKDFKNISGLKILNPHNI